jgi:hypothetical protein
MKRAILFLAVCGSLFSNDPVQTYTGRITDTMCGSQHGMVKGQPDEECIRTCVKGTSSQYALFDGTEVIRLSDQKTPPKFAGQRVKVTGTYNAKTKTIRVASIEPDKSAK